MGEGGGGLSEGDAALKAASEPGARPDVAPKAVAAILAQIDAAETVYDGRAEPGPGDAAGTVHDGRAEVDHGDAADRPKRKRRPPPETLLGLTATVDLWHDANRTAFASYTVAGHRENWPVKGREFRMWLAGEYFRATGLAVKSSELEDNVRIMEARAVNEGPENVPWLRVGRAGANLYVDLADPAWRAIEITATGWSVVGKPPVKFVRSSSMRPLPEPEAGDLIETLRRFVNVKADADFVMVVAWLVAALRERGPFPILALNGEHGSGKSMTSRMLRSLVDPSAAPIRSPPREDRDLLVSTGRSWVLGYDNLSGVPAWFSDALCRLATGGGFAARQLHTDADEVIFEAQRPILLNGIPELTDRADLADRMITIRLAAIPEAARRPEDEILAEFEAARPRILGALCDAVSAALRRVDEIRLSRLPRMADFAKWATAAEPGLGLDDGEFLDAYDANRRDVTASAFEADPVAVAIRGMVTAAAFPDGWEGTPTALLAALGETVSEATKRSRRWPDSARALGTAIERAAPLLRGQGYTIERRHSGNRFVIILPPPT